MRVGFQKSDWKGITGYGRGSEGVSSRGLVKITEAREVRMGSNDGQRERQGMIGQVEYKGMKSGVVHDQLLDNDRPDEFVIG